MACRNTFANPPRYENSYYGPINGILTSIFPPEQEFFVKPQPILRQSLPSESSIYLPPGSPPHPQASRSSSRIAGIADRQPGLPTHRHSGSVDSQKPFDSHGDSVLSRNEGGWDTILIPDFLVVKGSEDVAGDKILALVEVKRDSEEIPTAMQQVYDYLDAMQSKNYVDEFVALLVLGQTTHVWTTVPGNRREQILQNRSVETGSLQFCNLFLPLRHQYW
jgi:hypothetical protein